MTGISQPARHEMLYLDSLERTQRLKVPFGPDGVNGPGMSWNLGTLGTLRGQDKR